MPNSHKCPGQCGTTIWRREVKTCGSPQCLAEWRIMSPSQRIRMNDLVNDNLPHPISPDSSPFNDVSDVLSSIFGDKKGAN